MGDLRRARIEVPAHRFGSLVRPRPVLGLLLLYLRPSKLVWLLHRHFLRTLEQERSSSAEDTEVRKKRMLRIDVVMLVQ